MLVTGAAFGRMVGKGLGWRREGHRLGRFLASGDAEGNGEVGEFPGRR